MVHARDLEGRTLTFGHLGWLWNNAYLLYDRQTDSVWHHATGLAMAGPLRGKRLPRYTATALMTYDAWRAEHPGTLVLRKPDDPAVPVESDLYDERNRHVAFGFTVEAGGLSVFYPNERLDAAGVVHDEIGGIPAVIVRDPGAQTALAFDRRVDGRTLEFTIERTGGTRPVLLEKGGSRAWYLRSGLPVPGTGAEKSLCPLPATPWEREAWRLSHPTGSLRLGP